MLEIIVEPRRTFNLRQAITEAIASGDYDSLNDDIRDCFTEDQVDQIEEVLESGDIGDSIDDIVSEWNAEDVDDLVEAIENSFAEISIEIQFIQDDDFEEEVDKDFSLFEDDATDADALDAADADEV
ncbi:MAG: hypothetical protein GY847_12305 [Proteobacteria bacterium]|nr:hypothetical protein [Pseudomonadota bacterium]